LDAHICVVVLNTADILIKTRQPINTSKTLHYKDSQRSASPGKQGQYAHKNKNVNMEEMCGVLPW
jgi:hypothetical protein